MDANHLREALLGCRVVIELGVATDECVSVTGILCDVLVVDEAFVAATDGELADNVVAVCGVSAVEPGWTDDEDCTVDEAGVPEVVTVDAAKVFGCVVATVTIDDANVDDLSAVVAAVE